MRSRLRNKREKNENHLNRHVTENHVENHVESSKIPSKDKKISDEAIATKQTTESAEPEKTVYVKDELTSIKKALEEGEIDDSSNDIENNFKSISSQESTVSKVLPVFEEKFEVNGHHVNEVDLKIEDKKVDVQTLDAVNMIPTAEVHIACTTPISLNKNDCLQQQELQQQQHGQPINGIMVHNTAEENDSEATKLNGIPMETQSLDDDDVVASKVKLPIVNECEIIDTVNNQNQLKSIIVEDNPIGTKQPKDEIVTEPKLENNSEHVESIPQTSDSINSSESHNKIEPIDDSSNSMHNTSGSKSVNISTSYKDYLIVEDDNNEQIIYITRKKRKKKKKSVENV